VPADCPARRTLNDDDVASPECEANEQRDQQQAERDRDAGSDLGTARDATRPKVFDRALGEFGNALRRLTRHPFEPRRDVVDRDRGGGSRSGCGGCHDGRLGRRHFARLRGLENAAHLVERECSFGLRHHAVLVHDQAGLLPTHRGCEGGEQGGGEGGRQVVAHGSSISIRRSAPAG
jgi:hypothetical protein